MNMKKGHGKTNEFQIFKHFPEEGHECEAKTDSGAPCQFRPRYEINNVLYCRRHAGVEALSYLMCPSSRAKASYKSYEE